MITNAAYLYENSDQSQIIQPTLMLQQQLNNTQLKKQALSQIPLVPLRQGNKSQTTIRPSIFKSKVEESTQLNNDAYSLIAKLDSLREIQTQESPCRHHKSTYIQSQSNAVKEIKKTAHKTIQLQQNVFASCVEPFRSSKNITNSSTSQVQQFCKTVPPQKNYESLIESLMKEQDTVVKQYCQKLSTLEQKVIVLSQENTNLMEQNKLLLNQNIELNEEITQWKNQVNQYLEQSQINSQSQNDIQILEQQLEYKQDELNQTIQKLESSNINNLKQDKIIKELQQQINSILEQKQKDSYGYNSQINDQKQIIQELELKINQYIKNELQFQKLIQDSQNQIKSLEQSIQNSRIINQQTSNIKDQYEYKQLVLELDSKFGIITEKETQVEALKIKNSMLQQQLIQLQACQLGFKDYETNLKQKQQQINDLQQELQIKNSEFDNLSKQLQIIINNKNEEYEKTINELQQTLHIKNEELEKVSLQLKTVKKEKAKLSMNLITAGMANLVKASQSSTQSEIYT
ncbi:unnamed protein product [Paramecium primaurelia]|uniref:Uncharacterized protein n=1 Tax=Paramecium primaurelia TaxID=5886 RepID=A0A8S1NNG3_PARPR|nr:unnamed protein product [Paramecium primaurelia]